MKYGWKYFRKYESTFESMHDTSGSIYEGIIISHMKLYVQYSTLHYSILDFKHLWTIKII